jgi:omega-amidase
MNLRLTLVQTPLHWEDITANLDQLSATLANLEATDLVVLPEMFTTGFSMNAAQLAEPTEGRALQWMRNEAKRLGAVLTGSVMVKEQDLFFNRLLWVYPDGRYEQYDKKHLFTMAKEDTVFTAGQEQLVVEYKGWRIRPMVCYDLRFPAWNRNTDDYDLAIYVANWPAKRSYHWKSLLLARAIENQAYVAAVNCIGIDGKGFEYSGDSGLIDPAGTILYQEANNPFVETFELSKAHLKEVRAALPFLGDRDTFEFRQ